jgi:hypothetical protein|eukprot:31380-Pelagococcus_subviridis.AAC.16
MAGDDEASKLAAAEKQPWDERFKHSFWKARVAAYSEVVKEARTASSVAASPCLKAFGTRDSRPRDWSFARFSPPASRGRREEVQPSGSTRRSGRRPDVV